MSDTFDKNKLDHFRSLSKKYSDASILMHEVIAQKAGLSGTDHKYLGLMLEKGSLMAGEIASLTGLTTGAVTGLIDRLEMKKLVERQYDRSDRRKVIIVPNKENTLKLLQPLFSDLLLKTSELINTMTGEELRAVENYFSASIEIMNQVRQTLTDPTK